MIVPNTRPQLTRADAEAKLRAAGIDLTRPALLGIRGYYRDTMGVPRVNDRGIYDDALFIVAPELFASYNANTDPSITRPGIAALRPGTWLYQLGTHNLSKAPERRYRALVQAAPVTVDRDGVTAPDTGWFGINIHRGGMHTTSSEGCQTIYPKQWDAFLANVSDVLKRAGVKTLPYVLQAPA